MWYCRFHRMSGLCDHLRVTHGDVTVEVERASFTNLEEVYIWVLCAHVSCSYNALCCKNM